MGGAFADWRGCVKGTPRELPHPPSLRCTQGGGISFARPRPCSWFHEIGPVGKFRDAIIYLTKRHSLVPYCYDGGMTKTPKVTRHKFIAGYCRRSEVTWEWLQRYRDAVPCDCGEDDCEGWQMVPADPPPDKPLHIDGTW